MLAIQTVLFGSIVSILVAFGLYQNGRKEQGIMLCRATFGAVFCYFFLVIVIGFAPAWLG